MRMKTTWDIVLDYWTVTIFLPAVLLLIAMLAIITRISDRRSGH
jgi:hypothetical protein